MSSKRYERAKQIFLSVCGLSTQERSSVLDEACAGDAELRRDVEELLGFHSSAGSEKPLEPVAALLVGDDEVAGYRIVQRIGEGGMGEVYEAEQLEPVRRRVALKVVKWGMDSKEVLARFESERQAMALMSHPGIATVFDAGTTRLGRPYFAMEFVRGVPVTDYCDRQRLSTSERLELFRQVCDSVQHAHQRGVIHRDLKPSNILVAVEGDRAVPKIIDFGIAKATSLRLTERSLFTQLGQWIGTPEYMSPEQAEMAHLDVDTRSDVYSLGVVLYELLSGAAPFDPAALRAATFDEMRRTIREHEPPRPSTRVSTLGDQSEIAARRRRTDPSSLVRELRGDLDWIVMKALEKDRTRRYGSASELAADIERHLVDEPVLASPPSAAYRARKFVRRHRAGVVSAVVVVAALVLGIVGTTIGMLRAQREAEAARRVVELLSGVFGGMDPQSIAEPTTTIDGVLDRAERRIDRDLVAQPLVMAQLKTSIGQVRLGLGQHERARTLLEQAYSLRSAVLGADDPESAGVLNLLGMVSSSMGRFEEARELHRRALDIFSASFGQEHGSVGSVLGSLCFVDWRLGRFESALQECGRATELLARSNGPDSLQVCGVTFVTALVLRDVGRPGEALEVGERCLAVRERELPADHTTLGWSLWLVGGLRRATGDLPGARAALERALAIQEKALGPDSYAAAMCHQQLGGLLVAEGDLDGAVVAFDRTLALFDGLGFDDHPDLPWVLRTYGNTLERKGDPEGAERLLRRSVDMSERLYGTDHPGYAWTLAALGYHRARLGQLDEARALFTRALGILERTVDPTAPTIGTMRYDLACLDAREGRREEALEGLREVLVTSWAWPGVFEDEDLATLRGEPELEAFLKAVRQRLDGD